MKTRAITKLTAAICICLTDITAVFGMTALQYFFLEMYKHMLSYTKYMSVTKHIGSCLGISSNLALGRSTQQSSLLFGNSLYESGAVVDGSHNTDIDHGPSACTNIQHSPWWSVQLDGTHYISQVIIINRDHWC